MVFNNNNKNRRGRFIFFPLIAVAIALVLGGVVMLLWNAILPFIFEVKPLTYWQAVGLLVLCRVLFGNFRRGGPNRGGPPFKKDRAPWKDKLMQMTPEERDRFREEWRNRCRPKN